MKAFRPMSLLCDSAQKMCGSDEPDWAAIAVMILGS
jgi:hypothetical protein